MSQLTPGDLVTRPDLLEDASYSPPRVLRGNRLLVRGLAAYLVLSLAAGIASGFLWHLVVKLPGYTVGKDGSAVTTERQITEFFGSDAAYCAIGVVVGLLLGLLAWRWFRRVGWPVTVIALLGASIAASVTWWLGQQLGPRHFESRISKATSGQFVPIDFVLHSHTAVLLWQVCAIIPILVISLVVHDEEASPVPKHRRMPKALAAARRAKALPPGHTGSHDSGVPVTGGQHASPASASHLSASSARTPSAPGSAPDRHVP